MQDKRNKSDTGKEIREHYVNFFLPYELKERLRFLSRKYDRPMSDMARTIIRIGIPMMEGITSAEEEMIKEYMLMFRKLRKVRTLREL